jgi:hypothetical protein
MSAGTEDQAQSALFRVLLVLQLAVAVLFGLGPFLLPGPVAAVFGYTGHEPFYYQLAGAATIGYGLVAFFALRERTSWPAIKIPIAATFGFNLTAVLASAISLYRGDRQWIVVFVVIAASVFTLLTGYWLWRNQGPDLPDQRPISGSFKVILVLATAAAAVFGLGPLLIPRTFASLGGLSTDDMWVLRLAGASTFGYAVAGVLEIRNARWAAIRLQVWAAIAFNGLSAVAAAIYLIRGGRSWLPILILVAAVVFTAALAWGAYQQREGSTA